MCGISGIFSFEKFKDIKHIKKLATSLLLDIEIRGRHATGISLINTEKDTIAIYKRDIDAEQFVRTKKYHRIFKQNKDFNLILLHTRHATEGDADKNINNHPIYNKENNNVLIHNGIINNFKELREKHKLNCDGQVDSEVILSLFNKKGQNIKSALKYIDGSLAIAIYNKHKLYLYKNNNPLKMCYNIDKDLFMFSSHKDIFKELFSDDEQTIYEIFKHEREKEEYCIYNLENEDLIKIFFKRKRIKRDDAEIKDEQYKTSITWTTPTETEKKQAIEDEQKTYNHKDIKIINERDETDEFLRNEYNENNEYEDEHVDYLELLKNEDDNEQKEYNKHIHRQPLNEKIGDYNAYGRY